MGVEVGIEPLCLPRERLVEPYGGFKAAALPSAATLALCQSEAEVAHVTGAELSDVGNELSVDAVVALTPQAACECLLRGVDYLKLEDLYDAAAFLEADEPMLELQGRWADHVDALAWRAIPELAEADLRPAGDYFLFLKVLIDTVYRAALSLSHLLLAAGTGGTMLCFEPRRERSIPETLFFPGPIHADVLEILAPLYGVRAATLGPARGLASNGLREAAERLLPNSLFRELGALTHASRHGLVVPRPMGPEVVYRGDYDLVPLVDRLESQGLRGTPLHALLPYRPWEGRRRMAAMQRALSALWPRLKRDTVFREAFRWAGADLFPLAVTRLRHWLERVVPEIWRASVRFRGRLRARDVKAFVIFSPASAEDHGALAAARGMGIPTITCQHGGFEGNCEYITYDRTDLRQARHRLVYGEGIAAYLRERIARAPDLEAEVRATGSARLDELRFAPDRRGRVRGRLGLQSDEPLVIYVPSGYKYNWYLSRVAYLPVPYFELLLRVVETVKRFPSLRVAYKPFPERLRDPIPGLLERECRNALVVRDISLPELFQAGDALVMDLPSTALLEALLMPKPMLVHVDARFTSLRPEARRLLRRRVQLTETPDDFIAELERFLATEDFGPLPEPDDSFLRAYGTHLNDGRSAERAAQAVVSIIAEHGTWSR